MSVRLAERVNGAFAGCAGGRGGGRHHGAYVLCGFASRRTAGITRGAVPEAASRSTRASTIHRNHARDGRIVQTGSAGSSPTPGSWTAGPRGDANFQAPTRSSRRAAGGRRAEPGACSGSPTSAMARHPAAATGGRWSRASTGSRSVDLVADPATTCAAVRVADGWPDPRPDPEADDDDAAQGDRDEADRGEPAAVRSRRWTPRRSTSPSTSRRSTPPPTRR